MTTRIDGKEIPFRQAHYFQGCPRGRMVDLIVIHTADVPPRPGKARWLMDYCATYDAGPMPENRKKKKSWHYSVDDQEIAQSVFQTDIAYHAGHDANQTGIGIELATLVAPTPAQWADGYHQDMLKLAAALVGDACARWNMEPVYLDKNRLLMGMRGITTHAEVSKAFGQTDHTDPGPHFPMELFCALVAAKMEKG